MRTPHAIRDDLKALNDKAARAFVPPDLKRAAELAAEFAEATCAALDALAAKSTAAPAKSKR